MTAPEGNDYAKGNSGGGAPRGNTNGTKHGLHVEANKFYQKVMDDELRGLCDSIYDGYLKDYRVRYGDPHPAHRSRLFEIAVNHIKVLYSDNWASDRPSDVATTNPMVDKETVKKPTGDGDVIEQDTYKPSVVVGMQQDIRKEDRAWLKDYGLLNDPESQKADAQREMADAWREALEPTDE